MRRLTLAALALALGSGCASTPPDRPHRSARPHPGSTSPATGSPTAHHGLRGRIERLLADVAVRDTTYHPGFDRLCGPGHGCVFGPEWTDDHPGRFGHNGCDTRQDVLLTQMRHIEMRWGSSCRIYEADLTDPYTGERLTWRDDGYWIQIDHVYPLAQAWYAGAWAWPRERRLRFANDVERELLAVSGRANQDKGAGTPSEWLPGPHPLRCAYVAKYLAVASAYALPVTPADAATITRLAPTC